jgi:hypothetical protein
MIFGSNLILQALAREGHHQALVRLFSARSGGDADLETIV